MTPDDMTEELTMIFNTYSQQLEQKINRLETLWQALYEQQTEENYSEFYRGVHSLKGSTGIYGYKELHEDIVKLEDNVQTLKNETSLQKRKQEIDEALSNLKQNLKSSSREEALKRFISKSTNGE